MYFYIYIHLGEAVDLILDYHSKAIIKIKSVT